MLIGKISEELIFQYVEKTSALVFGNFTSLKSRIALQVARKIAPCNMALSIIPHGPLLLQEETCSVFCYIEGGVLLITARGLA
jgi:hypothetical protein